MKSDGEKLLRVIDRELMAIAMVLSFAAGSLTMDMARDNQQAASTPAPLAAHTIRSEADTMGDLDAVRYAALPLVPTHKGDCR